MSALNYQVITLDLATVRSAPGEAVLGQGIAYDSVTVLSMPVGATVFLSFGENKQLVPLAGPGCFRFKDACDRPYIVTESLRVSNPAGAGSLVLLVSTGGDGSLSTGA